MARPQPHEPILVKKYGNRRLYDTDQSRYLTLEELSDRIRDGVDVRVVDARTGDDLTQAVLTQIILESRRTAGLLPIPLLTQLIRLDDDAFAEFASRYLSAALDLYLQARHNARSLAAFNPMATMPFDVTGALARMVMGLGGPLGWGGPGSGPAGADVGGAPAAPQAGHDAPATEDADEEAGRSDELAALRRELDALKAAVAGGRKRGGGSSKRRRRGGDDDRKA